MVGRGRRGQYFLGYKVHYSCDWSSELPTAYTLKPANENEKRHFKKVVPRLRRGLGTSGSPGT